MYQIQEIHINIILAKNEKKVQWTYYLAIIFEFFQSEIIFDIINEKKFFKRMKNKKVNEVIVAVI